MKTKKDFKDLKQSIKVSLVSIIIFSLLFPGGPFRPKKSEALVITGTLAVLIVLSGCFAGASAATAIHVYKNDGEWPETDEEWDVFWFDLAEGFCLGGMWAIGGTVAAAVGSAAVAGHVSPLAQSVISSSIKGGTYIGHYSYEVHEAMMTVEERKNVLIANAIDGFREDHPSPTKEEVLLWEKFPEAYFGPDRKSVV